MTQVEVAELRAFLRCLAGEGAAPGRIPAALGRLAAGLEPSLQDVGDLVHDLVVDLLERSRRGQAGSAGELLLLDDAPFVSALRRRLRQVRSAAFPRWRLVKNLRALVAAAMRKPRPAPTALPLTLLEGGRLSGPRVAEAVAWLHADSGSQGVAAVARELLELYFSGGAEELAPAAPALDAEKALEAGAVLRLVDSLPAAQREALCARAAGANLAAIARQQGVAVSSAHACLGAALAAVGQFARCEGIGWAAGEPLLAVLAA